MTKKYKYESVMKAALLNWYEEKCHFPKEEAKIITHRVIEDTFNELKEEFPKVLPSGTHEYPKAREEDRPEGAKVKQPNPLADRSMQETCRGFKG